MSQRLFNSPYAYSIGHFSRSQQLFMKSILLMLLMIATCVTIFAQDSSEIDYHNITVHFSQNLGEGIDGEGNYKITPLNKEITEVNYAFKKKSLPNPYNISYKYNIYNNDDGSFEMDLKSAVEPTELRIDESADLKFTGDKLMFPKELKIGNALPDASGYFQLNKSGNTLLRYKVEISDRIILNEEEVSINGELTKAFVLSSTYTLEKYNKFDVLIQRSNQTITDWVIPSLGIVKQNREGSSVHGMDNSSTGSIYQFSHKSNLNSIQKN